ncbi:peroxiredoxin [Pontibacter sp. G13]|uniref:peroxiredoxin n=1 Tax=Pontibacter sp. G13 TaxID=3074898 RepID=UPI00288B9E04|nr:peroxiredoxin [Pontibacter sp. G13]WNJ16138.1 peroxiredoxin [Pontibacter sp. G13]
MNPDDSLLQPGQPIPDIELMDDEGRPFSIETMRGRPFILFVYRENKTHLCKTEICELRNYYPDIFVNGYDVVGLSPDTQESQAKTASKLLLNFNLVADPEMKLIKALGAYGQRMAFGKLHTGVYRSTFIIDGAGIIEHTISKVRSKQAADQLLDIIDDRRQKADDPKS